MLANHFWKVLKRVDERARVADLAYANTLPAPTEVKPAEGRVLEYAPNC